MEEPLFGRPRPSPTTPAPAAAAAPDTAQPSPLQEPAAPVQGHAPANQDDAAPPLTDEDFVLSVNDIRVKLENLGISKSKDSIQRYCRDGLLEWRKLGMFNRYYVTERSVEKLIDTLRLDEAAASGTQEHEAPSEEISDGVQVHEDAASEKTNRDNELQDTAPAEPQVHAGARNSGLEDEPLVIELRRTITRMEEGIEFLQDELRDRRQQTKALSAVIDAFQKNAETANLKALADQAQSAAASDTNYSAHVVQDGAEEEGDNQQSSARSHGV